jgi:tRNA(fMet)-specific endonuclease VapC
VTLPRNLVLDTSVLIHLVRNNWIGRSIESRFRLRTRVERPVVSIVTVGETLAFSKKLGWGESRLAAMEDLFSDLIVLNLSDKILAAYADLDYFLVRTGKIIQQNDIWIAATAVVSGAHLLTMDKDFDPLCPAYLDRTWIDPQRPDA